MGSYLNGERSHFLKQKGLLTSQTRIIISDSSLKPEKILTLQLCLSTKFLQRISRYAVVFGD